MKILVNRMGARGDVLAATGILPALKKKYPDSKVDFKTDFPDILYNNEYIDRLIFEAPPTDYDLYIDLDMSYENRPTENIMDVYADVAKVDVADCKTYINCSQVNKELFKDYVVVHAGNTNWAGRNWIPSRFKELGIKIHNSGHQIICVGSQDDNFVPCDSDTRGKTTIGQLATIIKDCKLFVGIDSLPMHIAQVFNKNGVVFFGSIKPETRIYTKNIKTVNDTSLPCIGCHHKKMSAINTTDCMTQTLDCEKNIGVETMWKVVDQLLSNTESWQ